MNLEKMLGPKLVLSDYYIPSDEFKTNEMIAIVIVIGITTFIAYKVGKHE